MESILSIYSFKIWYFYILTDIVSLFFSSLNYSGSYKLNWSLLALWSIYSLRFGNNPIFILKKGLVLYCLTTS